MPRREGSFISGVYYHIFNRVVEGELLFQDHNNYVLCLTLVKRNASKYNIDVLSYCLMPNHYHFLLQQKSDIPISKFSSVLFNTYVQKVNQLRGRKGSLFTGRFKHVLVDREEYLIHLCRYIHLNPVKAGLVQNPEDWFFSNYLDWIGMRQGELRDPKFIETYFSSAQEYREFVLDFEDEQRFEERISGYILD